MEGWQVASKGLGPLPRRRGSALARGCGRGGRVVLPLARAAAVSTGLRVRGGEEVRGAARHARVADELVGGGVETGQRHRDRAAWLGLGLGLGVGVGLGLGLGLG